MSEMKTYKVGEVYEVSTPHNSGIYKVVKVQNDTVYYKAATPYLGGQDFRIGSNFSDCSTIVLDINDLLDNIVERLNQIVAV